MSGWRGRLRIALAGRLGGFCALAAALLPAAPAAAHPHVWVAAKTDIVFDHAGMVTGVRHEWVFDEMYSAFAVEGLEKDGKLASREALAPLAKTNVESLTDFDYFTFAKAGGRKVSFGKPTDYWLEERPDKRVVLHFTLPLATPMKTGRAMSLQVYDPPDVTDCELDAKDPGPLVGAPTGCSDSVLGANPLVVADGKQLAKAFDTGLAPSDDFALKMASRIIVACP